MPTFLKQQLFSRPMQAQQGEGGEAGGGEGAGPGVDVQAAIDAAVAGLKAKNGEVIADNKRLKEQLSRFDGIDPDAVRNILKRFSDDEEAGLIQAGKVDEVLNKRTERMKADYDKKLAAAMQAAEAATQRAQAFQGRVLDDAIRAAAVKAGLHQHAIDDALFRARSMFTLDENGSAVQLDADGSPVLGKDGKTPFTPMEWLEGMKDKAPHWFPATASGSGATSYGGGHGHKTLRQADIDAMSPKDRAAFFAAGGRAVA